MNISKTFLLGLSVATMATAMEVSYIVEEDDGEISYVKGNNLAQVFASEGEDDTCIDCDTCTDCEFTDESIDDMHTKGYFKTEGYQSKSAQEKFNELWYMITEDTTPADYIWDNSKLFTNKFNGSFCQNSDEQKGNRDKVSHRNGLVASFKWVPYNHDSHGYTGFYEQESTLNILRFSQTLNLTDDSQGLLPSVALKFLIDGIKAENIFGMPSFHESNSWDFFAEDMRSRVDPVTDQCFVDTMEKKLVEGSNRPYSTSTTKIADRFVDGVIEVADHKEIKAPYELVYRSPFKGHNYDEMVDERDWMTRLQEIGKEGTHILDIFAKDTVGDEPFKVAEVILTSDLLTSKFGDERLHFQHTKTQRDRKYWTRATREADPDPYFNPRLVHEWDTSTFNPDGNEDVQAFVKEVNERTGCPFGWLIDSFYGENNTVVVEEIYAGTNRDATTS